jgi:mannose-1-phosphate guanylyltransferase
MSRVRNTISQRSKLQRHDSLITIGIRPNYPETGYGYIMKGNRWVENRAAYQVKHSEKPSVSMAQQLIRKGSLWNSGIFVWKASSSWN